MAHRVLLLLKCGSRFKKIGQAWPITMTNCVSHSNSNLFLHINDRMLRREKNKRAEGTSWYSIKFNTTSCINKHRSSDSNAEDNGDKISENIRFNGSHNMKIPEYLTAP